MSDDIRYKACLHAAVEDPRFQQWSDAEAACAGIVAAGIATGETYQPTLGPGGQQILNTAGGIQRAQAWVGPGGLERQHLLGPGGIQRCPHLLGGACHPHQWVGGNPSTWGPPLRPQGWVGGNPATWGPGAYGPGLPYVPATSVDPLANELSSPFVSSGGVLWRDNPNSFNQFDPFGTATPLNTYSNGRGGRFSQYYTQNLF